MIQLESRFEKIDFCSGKYRFTQKHIVYKNETRSFQDSSNRTSQIKIEYRR